MSIRELERESVTEKPQPKNFFQEHWQKIFAVSIWAVLIGGYTWYARANDMDAVDAVQALADFLSSPYGALVYWLAYSVRPLLFFPATILTVAAGSIFGPLWGVVLTIIASNTSAMIAYMVGRYFGEGIIKEEEESNGLIQRYAKRMRSESFATVMLMRLLFLPYDLVNYLSGFLKIDWKAFLFATALGSIPGTISFVLFGSSIDIRQGLDEISFNPWSLAASIALIVVSIGISRYLRRREGVVEDAQA